MMDLPHRNRCLAKPQPLSPGLVSRVHPNSVTLTPEQVTDLIGKLFEAQDLYRRSGGVHTSALSDGREMLVTCEDIGRHNSLDKIAGRCLLEDIQPQRRILLTTGRISSEMLQKSARMGASVIISRTSPSSLSIRLAERWGVTLIGYARRTGFRIYAHPERILQPSTEFTDASIPASTNPKDASIPASFDKSPTKNEKHPSKL